MQCRMNIAVLITAAWLFLAADPAAAKTIYIAVSNPDMSFLSGGVAKYQGYFKDEGLDVEVLQMNANVSVAALAAGNVDYNLILQSVVTANLRGLPLKIAGILIVLESDGRLLLSLFNLPTLANLDPKHLNVFVFDNQVYSGTRISEPTATAGKTDLAMMARGAGIEHAVTVASLPEFQAEMEAGLNGEGLKFVVCKVEESVRHREILRTDLDPLENKYQFVRYLERTEGRAIFRGRG